MFLKIRPRTIFGFGKKESGRTKLVVASMIIMLLAVSGFYVRAVDSATIETSKNRYDVGETMHISGSGFAPNVSISISVELPGNGGTEIAPPVVSDANGAFSDALYAPAVPKPGRYKITATDNLGASASTASTEADAVGYNKGIYDKGVKQPNNDLLGNWTSGNAGKNFLEGQWVFYSYQLTGVVGSVPDFDIYYDHFSSSGSAIFIDALNNFRVCISENCEGVLKTSDPNNQGLAVGMLKDHVPTPPPTTAGGWINAFDAVSNINHPFTNNTCQSTIDPKNTPSQFHCVHVSGAALTTLINNFYGSNQFNGAERFVTFYVEAHLAKTTVWSSGNEWQLGCPGSLGYATPGSWALPGGPYGTDVYNPNPPSGDPCNKGANAWDTTAFIAAGGVPGSSGHFNLNPTVGSNGAITLPIPTTEAPTGSIKIVKVTNPAAFNIDFDYFGTFGAFKLNASGVSACTGATDTTTTDCSAITFSQLAAGDVFTVTENALPVGWTLANINCVNNTGSSTFAYTGANADPGYQTGDTTLTVTLATTANAAVTCTYTNDGAATLRMKKIVDPAPDATSFSYTVTGTGYNNFSLVGAASPGGTANVQQLSAGTYTATETVPAGYSLTNRTCALTAGGSHSFSTSVANQISIALTPGEDVTCTFTNNKPDMSIKVETTDTNEINDDHVFTVTVTIIPNGATSPSTVNITRSVSPTPDTNDTTCGAAVAVVANVATCTVTINDAQPGVFNVDAAVTATVGGVSLTRDTAGTSGPGGNDGASKTFVDANISINPPSAVNPVGDTHVITGHVNVNTGSGGYVNAPAGTIITFAIVSGPGTLSPGPPFTCATVGATGSCTINLTSATTGTTTISASTTVTVGGVALSRTTNGSGGNSSNATKTWVDSSVTTQVHNTAHTDVTFPGTASVPLGTVIHDRATVDVGAGLTIPAGSTFTFLRYTNLTCSGDPANTQAGVAISSVLQTGSAESNTFTPGAGDYSYKASFVSGDTALAANKTGVCEPFKVAKAQLGVTTIPHNAADASILNSSVPLGSITHDTATLTGVVAGFTAPDPTFTLTSSYTGTCAAGAAVANNGTEGAAFKSAASAALGAGAYAYRATVAGNDNYIGATGVCEPFTVSPGTLGITTTLHNAAHATVPTNTSPLTSNLLAPVTIHDQADVTGLVAGFASGDVSFLFFTNTTCTGSGVAAGTVTGAAVLGAAGVAHPSTDTSTLNASGAGFYAYRASVATNTNYTGATSSCEPFVVNSDMPLVKLVDGVTPFCTPNPNENPANPNDDFTPPCTVNGQPLANSFTFSLFAQNATTRGITGATNTAPITVTVASTTGLANGNSATVFGVNGNTAANGTWLVANVTATTFQLVGSTGNGAYTSGGTAMYGGQPTGSALATVVVPPSLHLPGLVGTPLTICETDLPAGWSMALQIITTPSSPVPNPYPTYTPAGTDDVCFNIRIPEGSTEFQLLANNVPPPGGGTRTIGYWANWTTCDGKGNQVDKDPDFTNPMVTLLDEVLGVLDIGLVVFPQTTLPVPPGPNVGCAIAVDLLKKSDIGSPALVGDGANRANDAAYGMAAQLIAAEANYGAGALTCANATTAIDRAKTLLDQISFTGTGAYLPPKDGISLKNYKAVREYALALADILDAYNNIHNAGTCSGVPAAPAVVTPNP